MDLGISLGYNPAGSMSGGAMSREVKRLGQGGLQDALPVP